MTEILDVEEDLPDTDTIRIRTLDEDAQIDNTDTTRRMRLPEFAEQGTSET